MKLRWVIALTGLVLILVALGFQIPFVPEDAVIQELSSDSKAVHAALHPLVGMFMSCPFRLGLLGLNGLSLAMAIRGPRRQPAQGVWWAMLIAVNALLIIPNLGQAYAMPKVLEVYRDMGVR